MGRFTVQENHLGHHQLNVGDGTNHVHIDWQRVKRVEVSDFHGEGLLTFFDGNETLFKFYRPAGAFGAEVMELVGDLVTDEQPSAFATSFRP